MGVISSPRTAVHLVTLLEEMPVQETLDGIEELRDNNPPVGAVIVNMERGPRLTPEGLRDALDGTLDVDEFGPVLKLRNCPASSTSTR